MIHIKLEMMKIFKKRKRGELRKEILLFLCIFHSFICVFCLSKKLKICFFMFVQICPCVAKIIFFNFPFFKKQKKPKSNKIQFWSYTSKRRTKMKNIQVGCFLGTVILFSLILGYGLLDNLVWQMEKEPNVCGMTHMFPNFFKLHSSLKSRYSLYFYKDGQLAFPQHVMSPSNSNVQLSLEVQFNCLRSFFFFLFLKKFFDIVFEKLMELKIIEALLIFINIYSF